MRNFSVRPLVQSRYPLAIVAGLLLAAAFPGVGIAGFAWIAPGLMLAAALGTGGTESFRIGYVAGLALYLASLHWLLFIPVTGFPILGWVALSAFLALFPATWVWAAIKLAGKGTAANPWLKEVERYSSWSWSQRVSWAFSCAALWVGLEMIRARVLGGFPWNLLGVSQYQLVPLIQIASITGVYGVSFLMVWASVSLLCGAMMILGKPGLRSVWVAEIILPFVAVAALFFFGVHRIAQAPAPARELKLTLVQPSIPQTLIWNPDNDLARFRGLIRLSEAALSNQTDVLIWPEAAIPGLPRYDPEMADPISALARSHKVWMVIGADDAEVTTTATNYYNASFLISPEGRLVDSYHKRSLVMFGEYIPFQRWLPFIQWFTPITGSYTPGTRAVQFDLGNLEAQTSVLICFEDVFPQLARASVDRDTDFLVNITNDGWFGESAAQWQHAANATFRAVENDLPLVRCANTGLTCWIDPNGRIRQIFTNLKGSVYGAGFMTIKLPLPPAGEQHALTFYHQHGDWFGWSCAGLAALALLVQSARRRS